jgi:hypothetical protein
MLLGAEGAAVPGPGMHSSVFLSAPGRRRGTGRRGWVLCARRGSFCPIYQCPRSVDSGVRPITGVPLFGRTRHSVRTSSVRPPAKARRFNPPRFGALVFYLTSPRSRRNRRPGQRGLRPAFRSPRRSHAERGQQAGPPGAEFRALPGGLRAGRRPGGPAKQRLHAGYSSSRFPALPGARGSRSGLNPCGDHAPETCSRRARKNGEEVRRLSRFGTCIPLREVFPHPAGIQLKIAPIRPRGASFRAVVFVGTVSPRRVPVIHGPLAAPVRFHFLPGLRFLDQRSGLAPFHALLQKVLAAARRLPL